MDNINNLKSVFNFDTTKKYTLPIVNDDNYKYNYEKKFNYKIFNCKYYY